jgi:hypothetical protein
MSIPTDRDRANIVILFSVNLRAFINVKVAIMEVGNAIAEIIVLFKLLKKRETTSITIIEPKIR